MKVATEGNVSLINVDGLIDCSSESSPAAQAADPREAVENTVVTTIVEGMAYSAVGETTVVVMDFA